MVTFPLKEPIDVGAKVIRIEAESPGYIVALVVCGINSPILL